MAEELTYCTLHPDRETSLRCNKCGRLMCTDCAVATPVGYRCRQCVRQIENKFFTATPNDNAIVGGVCAALGGIGGFIMTAISLGPLLGIFAGIIVGGGITELALKTIQRRRSRYADRIGAAAVVIGGLIGGILQNVVRFQGRAPFDLVIQFTLNDWGLLAFVGVTAFIVYTRFSMRG